MRKDHEFNLSQRGQHLLTDADALSFLSKKAESGAHIVEVGPGTGNVTALLAKKAKRVTAFEIDPSFEADLDKITRDHPNVEIKYGNVLQANLKKVFGGKKGNERKQVIASLPYQISEPFLKKLVDLPIDEAVLILGEQMGRRIETENPENLEYGKTGALVQTFFDTIIAKKLGKESFSPAPSTNSVIAVLTPRDRDEIRSNPKTSILSRLFQTEKKHQPIKVVIKEAIDSTSSTGGKRGKKEENRHDRRQTRQELRSALRRGDFDSAQEGTYSSQGQKELSKLNLPGRILDKPFSELDNQDIRDLVTALNNRYNR